MKYSGIDLHSNNSGLAIQSNLAVVATLNEQIVLLEKRLQEEMDDRTDYGLLTTVPGIVASPVKGLARLARMLNGMPFAVARATKRITCSASPQGVGTGSR